MGTRDAGRSGIEKSGLPRYENVTGCPAEIRARLLVVHDELVAGVLRRERRATSEVLPSGDPRGRREWHADGQVGRSEATVHQRRQMTADGSTTRLLSACFAKNKGSQEASDGNQPREGMRHFKRLRDHGVDKHCEDGPCRNCGRRGHHIR